MIEIRRDDGTIIMRSTGERSIYYREKGNPDAPWKEADWETEKMLRENTDKYEIEGLMINCMGGSSCLHITDQGEWEWI